MSNRKWIAGAVFCVTPMACKTPTTEARPEPTATTAPVGVPAPTFSTIPIVPAPPDALVQVVIATWLTTLAAGQDEDFLRQAAVAEETQKLLEHRSMSDIARDFKAKRHATVVKILTAITAATPAQISTEGTRTLVRFQIAGERDATFVVDDGHVTLRGVYGP